MESEAGVVASVILKPELTFYSEQLTPHYFTNEANAYLYYACSQLAKRGVTKVDAYNITSVLNANAGTKEMALKVLSIPAINEFISNAPIIARSTVEEYRVVSDNVLHAAFRRKAYEKLEECKAICYSGTEKEIEEKIYSTLDDVMMEFSTTSDVPQYKDVVDELWAEIRERQDNGMSGIPFKFPTLNKYVTIEPGELIIFAAEAKQGKSMLLLNCAVDLLAQGKSVLYIDSELNSRLFTCRMVSHLSGIEFSRVRSGNYTEAEATNIEAAIGWIKTRQFTHLYMPIFDAKGVYTVAKRMKHTQDIQVIIIDYFKSNSDATDAWGAYADLGRFVDMVKNDTASVPYFRNEVREPFKLLGHPKARFAKAWV